MGLDSATRRTRTPTHRGLGTPAARGDPRRPSRRWPRTSFWVGPVLEQFRRATMHGQLRFQVTDSLACRDQLGLLRRGQARLEPAVDAVLAPPRVDRLIADPEVDSDLRDLAPSLDQIEHTTPKL